MDGLRVLEDELDAELERWTSTRDRYELAEALQARGVLAGPLQNTPDLVHRDPFLREDHLVRVDHPSGRRVSLASGLRPYAESS
jgi:crotonobetainyl-CoA:carnitine CoA-transferase CaiB-like acyl-CoA transferase